MNSHAVITSQYEAALEMLRTAVTQCPDNVWINPQDKNPFWQVAYHALFYTHLYVQSNPNNFTVWAKTRGEAHNFDQACEPYTKEELLEYYAFCRQQVAEQVPCLALDAPSGFHWLPFSKLELQFYNIRHLQQHTGELYERLGAAGITELQWVGSR